MSTDPLMSLNYTYLQNNFVELNLKITSITYRVLFLFFVKRGDFTLQLNTTAMEKQQKII